MKLSLISSFLFLAAIVNAADNDHKQMCYKTCVHKLCNGSNASTLCLPVFLGTYVHVDYRRRSRVPDAVHASICSMAPLEVTNYIESDYDCVLS
ncbi:hypothetical protein BGX30_013447 [Mortierella sp. GBA39]|nr:hypothetical protein BGX30_013447 [Mortierella sp. GBA39]